MGCRPLRIQTLKRCLSSTKFKSGVSGSLASFVNLIEKGNDDVTKIKLLRNYGVGLHTLNDVIDAV